MPPEQEIQILEDLILELLKGLQELIQAGEVIDAEFQTVIAQQLNAATARIDELLHQNPVEAMQPPVPPPNVPQLDQGPFPSSNVNSFKYNPDTGELFVKFHGKDSADSGPVYSYQGVPRNIYDVFSHGRVAPKTSGQNQYHRWIRGVTPSLGASLYALIRNGGYPYQRLT